MMLEEGVRVVVVGGWPILRRGLVAALGEEPWLDVCANTGTAAQARRLCEEMQPALIVLDLNLPGADGLGLARELSRSHRKASILAISAGVNAGIVHRAFQAGVHGIVSMEDELGDLTNGLRKLWAGDKGFIGERLGGSLLRQMAAGPGKASPAGIAMLSTREAEVFRLLGRKQRTAEIAASLGVSVKTVETHYKRIKQKLGLRTAEEMSRRAAAGLLAESHPAPPPARCGGR